MDALADVGAGRDGGASVVEVSNAAALPSEGGGAAAVFTHSLGFPSITMQWGAFTRARVRVASVDGQQT